MNLAWAVAGVVAFAFASGASARVLRADTAIPACANAEDRDDRIEACTFLIDGDFSSTIKSAAYRNRGEALRQNQDRVGARRDFGEAIRRDPARHTNYWQRALISFDEENYAAVIADCNRALALNPAYADCLNTRGNAYYRLDDDERAMADYNEAIRVNPRHAPAFMNRANVKSARNDLDGALADYTHSISLAARSPALNNRGNLYIQRGEYALGLADHDRAVRITPDNARYHADRCWGRAVANQELDVAREACATALRLDPTLSHVYGNRGVIALREQAFQEAWNDFNQAASLDAENGGAVYLRGIAALRMGRAEDAERDFAAAVALEPDIVEWLAAHNLTR